MNQRLQDLATLLKKDRKSQVIAGAVVLGLMFLVFAEPKKHTPQPKRDMKLAQGSGAGSTDERYGDLLTRFNSQLDTVQQQAHETNLQLQQQIQRNEEYEKRTAEIFKRMLERMAETEAAVVQSSYAPGGGPNVGDGSGAGLIAGAGAGGLDGTAGGAGSDAAAAAAGLGGGAGSLGGAGGLGGNGAYGAGGNGLGGGALGANGFGSAGGPGGYNTSGGSMGGAQAMNVSLGADGMPMNQGEPDSPESFGFDEPRVAPPPPPPVKRSAMVGRGDSVRVQLLAGVNAPTDGTPYPVVMKLIGDVQGPDGSNLPLGEARVIAAAQGSLTDGRALFRLSSLNLRLPNGQRKVIDIDGYVVGEDGKLGMEGVLIDPLSKILGAVAIAGAVEGTGSAYAQSQTTTYRGVLGNTETEVSGDIFKYGAGKGVQNASKEWSGIIKERAQQMVPHVEVLSGRMATAVFSQSFVITDLYEALEQGNEEDGSL